MKKVIKIFKALSDRNRLRIFLGLNCFKELCACQIIEFLNVSGATVSRHIGILLGAGLLKSRKEGRWTYYTISNDELSEIFSDLWIDQILKNSEEFKSDLLKLEKICAVPCWELTKKQRRIS